MAPSLGIDAVFDHVIVDAGNHATDGEAVLTRVRIRLDGVADHLALGKVVVEVDLVCWNQDLRFFDINGISRAAVELQAATEVEEVLVARNAAGTDGLGLVVG